MTAGPTWQFLQEKTENGKLSINNGKYKDIPKCKKKKLAIFGKKHRCLNISNWPIFRYFCGKIQLYFSIRTHIPISHIQIIWKDLQT